MKLAPSVGAAFILACLIAHPSPGVAKSLDVSTPLPEAVEKTYRAAFPHGEITRLDVTDENGVSVYDIEFNDGPLEKETDISGDGTMLEFTLVIAAKEVPTAAMKTIKKAATGAKIGRIERIELSYETKDGKVVKLAEPRISYAAEMTKGKKKAEIVAASDGTVVEPATWAIPPK